MPYEERLLLSEAEAIGTVRNKTDSKLNVVIAGSGVERVLSRLHRLTYFSHFSIGSGPLIPTQQFLLETTANGNVSAGRQSTRYSTHGLHDYKGKFHPQIARFLMGQAGLTTESLVLDPFAGSGTVLVEAVHYGCNAIGVEANPLAVLVANAKLRLLTCTDDDFRRFRKSIVDCIASLRGRRGLDELANELGIGDRSREYLACWFAPAVLSLLLEFRASCRSRLSREWSPVADAILSSIAREVSHQDPADLRIRRRKAPLKEAPVTALLDKAVSTLLARAAAARNLFGGAPTFAAEFLGDSRKLSSALASAGAKRFDAIITSPPYATALPYIDTCRLSLVLVGLCSASDLRRLEKGQIGNREISASERKQAENSMESKLVAFPKELQTFIRGLVRKLRGSEAGFRKLNMPALLVQYFCDIHEVLEHTYRVSNRAAHAYWLVGPNRTQVSGEWLQVDTPRWIAAMAEQVGFTTHLDVLDTYQRFGLHERNGIREEFLISMMPC
ncbi:MAG: TRM11 family SAM-dependent methyltransferase [Terriglobales bacterium]